MMLPIECRTPDRPVWITSPFVSLLLLLGTLAACQAPNKPPPAPAVKVAVSPPPATGAAAANARVPAFVSVPFEPFTRADAVAIAQREWRLFGQPVDDDPPDSRPPLPPERMPERMPGLWERVGEYYWEGLDPGLRESAWTGMHDENGTIFDSHRDSDFAWSAAFISYVMRIAGAGPRFPYASSHSTYINAAVRGEAPVLRAHPINGYAPRTGDIICAGRDQSARLRFARLPAPPFPSHCDIVVSDAPGTLTVIGGNVDDAVTAKHVPVGPDGMLGAARGAPIDSRYAWFVVLEVLYDR